MDQIKIGKFIAATRSAKKITQEELAKEIGVTDKAISKWENGRCLPDVSLFKPLCKALDISVNELLNGEKDTKSNKEDGYINYIKETNKKTKLKLIITILVSTTILVLLLLSIYFINNYGKTTIYRLSGTSENFIYTDALLTISNEKYILVNGKVKSNNNLIKESDIKEILIKSNDEKIVGGTDIGLSIEDVGYNEMFNKDKIYNLNNWYLVVSYQTEDGLKQEIIKLQNEKILKNNKFIPTIVEPIGENKEEKKEQEKTTSEKYDEWLERLSNELPRHGYIQSNKNIPKYCNKISSKEHLCVNILTDRLEYTMKESNGDYIAGWKNLYFSNESISSYDIRIYGDYKNKKYNQYYNEKTKEINPINNNEYIYEDNQKIVDRINEYYPSIQKIYDKVQ